MVVDNGPGRNNMRTQLMNPLRHLEKPADNHSDTQQSHQVAQATPTLLSTSSSTCLLSVSGRCEALGETYHPLRAPGSKSETLRMYTMHRGARRCQDGVITLVNAPFQKAHTCTPVASTSYEYKPEQETLHSTMCNFLFIRHYLGNPV